MKKLILASASPRRRELLMRICHDFAVVTADCDENVTESLSPDALVCELAKRKAESVLRQINGGNSVVIGADTVVALDGHILGKPKNETDAVECLLSLAGREHSVYTGMCVTDGEKCIVGVYEAKVRFAAMTTADAKWYVSTGEPMDKAGAYGIQGIGGIFVESVSGDYYATVGLPICPLRRILHEDFGF